MRVTKGTKVKWYVIKDTAADRKAPLWQVFCETRVPSRIVHNREVTSGSWGTNCLALPGPTLAESITELAGIRGAQACDWSTC